MNTTDLFKNKTVFSLEVFPPKREASLESIYKTFGTFKEINPDFISVTYGAGGSSNINSTANIANTLVHDYGYNAVAHLAAIGLKKSDVHAIVDHLLEIGVNNILALRGDARDDLPQGDFNHAVDLIEYLKANYGDKVNIIAACYPEGHNEAKSFNDDLRHLKEKVDAGASHLISQLFFNNESFYNFRESCDLIGINVPIEAGIMPVANTKQIERIVTLCGVELPKKFTKIMSRYEDNSEALRDAGIAYAVDQIVDLVTQGVSGIHLYTMNNPYIATKIYGAIKNIL